MADFKEYMRNIPAVHILQSLPRFQEISTRYHIPQSQLTNWLQLEINQLREKLLANIGDEQRLSEENIIDDLLNNLEYNARVYDRQRLHKVINGTGVILHTNMGRARLSDEAVHAIEQSAIHYSNVEMDLASGKRGARHRIVESLICQLTGAEAAMVVNNNAAAVYLVLRALANDREVIVSRGELVEIGGSFRVSSIMEESGARLIEVGTTNKTHFYDYEAAVSQDSAMVMKVHRSNFRIEGFTDDVDMSKLSSWSRENGLISYEDLGSGAFYDFRKHGVSTEQPVSEIIDTGVDLVTCSGDKLLGGPQAGIIAGKKQWIDQLKNHQLARVLRVDKMTLAGLQVTLQDYVNGRAAERVPAVRDIVADAEQIKERAKRFMDFMASAAPDFHCRLVQDQSQVGGGTMPGVFLPTYGVNLEHDRFTAQSLVDALRKSDPPVIARMNNHEPFLDFRTISDEELEDLISALRELL